MTVFQHQTQIFLTKALHYAFLELDLELIRLRSNFWQLNRGIIPLVLVCLLFAFLFSDDRQIDVPFGGRLPPWRGLTDFVGFQWDLFIRTLCTYLIRL